METREILNHLGEEPKDRLMLLLIELKIGGYAKWPDDKI